MRSPLIGVLITVAQSVPTAITAQAVDDSWFQIGTEYRVGALPGRPIVEPHLAVSRMDPQVQVVGAMVAEPSDLSVIDCAAFATHDGGTTWESTLLGLESCADPWVTFAPDGAVLLSVLSDVGILVYRSVDGGHNWPSAPLVIPGAHDHQMFVTDHDRGVVYLVSGESVRRADGRVESALSVARSRDNGRRFAMASRYVASNLSYEAQNPVVLSDGDLVVPFQDHHRWDGRRLRMRRSWLVVSQDAGDTWSQPFLISEGCNRVGPVGWPSLVAAPPGAAETDRLYWTCEEEAYDGILMAISDDRGITWRDLRPILNDSSTSTWTKTPAVAVTRSGVLGIAWYDRGEDPQRQCQHVMFTVSIDGGDRFLPPVSVTRSVSCPSGSANGVVADRFPAGGDYSGLAALDSTGFVIVWADARRGAFELKTATIRVRSDGLDGRPLRD